MEGRPINLPEEIIEEILLRLAVKSLLRFRCVSKSYCSLIDSKRFIKTHHQKSSKDSSLAHHRFLEFSYSHTDRAMVALGCPLLSYFDEPEYNLPNLDLPPNVSVKHFVGLCNGLVCIVSGTDGNNSQFILWNPSTRVSKILPLIDKNKIAWYKYKHVGFGWDESSDEYKVIALYNGGNKRICKMYNLKTDSWKVIDSWKEIHACHINSSCTEVGVLASGKLYWQSGSRQHKCKHKWENIFAFDLKREVFENNVEKPCYNSKGCVKLDLGTFGGCFSVRCSYEGYGEIWAMKEECWVKVMHDDYAESDIWTSPCVQAFYKSAEREIVLMNNMNYHGKHLAYDLKNQCFHGPYTQKSDIYFESLVSPFV